jgi:UDP-N-acetylmuramyl pentapeptide synthase
MDYVIITNITKDQPPRQRHYDFIFDEIKKGLTKDMKLILNGDDPYLMKYALNDFSITYFGIAKDEDSYFESRFPALNISRCPACRERLVYDYYHIEYLGKYKCNSCSFSHPQLKYELTKYNKQKKEITINDDVKIKIENDMLFNKMNTMAAYSLLSELRLDQEKIRASISDISKNKNIYDYYIYNGKKVYILNNKNENATTFNQAVLYTSKRDEKKTIIIGWREISRRYQYDDLSWLYDIEFELLNDSNLEQVIVCGPQRYDIAVRLKYANIPLGKIKIFEHFKDAKGIMEKGEGNIYAILNFDYIKPVNDILEGK